MQLLLIKIRGRWGLDIVRSRRFKNLSTLPGPAEKKTGGAKNVINISSQGSRRGSERGAVMKGGSGESVGGGGGGGIRSKEIGRVGGSLRSILFAEARGKKR